MSRRERIQAVVRMVDQGRELHIAGRNDEAEKIFRDVIALDSNNAETLHRLGMILEKRGDLIGALPLMERSLGLAPLVPEFHNNMGELYRKAGFPGEARISYLRAVELRPGYYEAINNLALAQIDLSATGDAVITAKKAVSLAPHDAQVHFTLGMALSVSHRYAEAVAALREALRLRPDFDEARGRLIVSLAGTGVRFEQIAADFPNVNFVPLALQAVPGYWMAGRIDIAEPLIDRALAEDPNNAFMMMYKGNICKDRGDTDGAEKMFEAGMHLGGGPMAMFNLAICKLKKGNFKQGLAGYELRTRPAQPRDGGAPRPIWDGSDPTGKTILVTHEQGFGDTFMFIRYVPLLAKRGARVWVQAVKELHDLLKSVEGVSRLVDPNEQARGFNYCLPIVSMPFLFDTELETIPASVPYIKADPARISAWKEKLSAHGKALRVGLVWQGNPAHRSDHRRSLPLNLLSPLGEIPGVKLFSLQKGKGSEQLGQPGAPQLIDLAPELKSFMETAAAMESLDLVIAVDTAVIHLAGAMGRPVWSLHAIDADFRWMEGRSDSPWYPSMRLYRQKALGDWSTVVGEVAQDLAELARKKEAS